MTLYKQDVMNQAALETLIADNLSAKNTMPMIQMDARLYQAVQTSRLRAAAMAEIALTLGDKGDEMPAPNPTGRYAATGNVIQINFDGNSPTAVIPGWNAVANDRQLVDSASFLTRADVQSSIYKIARTNAADANFYGETTAANTGVIPDAVMQANHTVVAGYFVNDIIGGANTNYAYDMAFYGSRMADSEFTQFTVGDDTKILDCSHNTTRGVLFPKIRCSSLGRIYWTWGAAPNTDTEAAAMAALVITEFAPA